MTLWDGLSTSENCQVLVMGATNRPSDIDPAFLRRLPKRFKIDLPSTTQRQDILEKLLAQPLAKGQLASDVNIARIAELCYGFSGSELKELCRTALMIPIQERYREIGSMKTELGSKPPGKVADVRKVSMIDFESKAKEMIQRARSLQFQNTIHSTFVERDALD